MRGGDHETLRNVKSIQPSIYAKAQLNMVNIQPSLLNADSIVCYHCIPQASLKTSSLQLPYIYFAIPNIQALQLTDKSPVLLQPRYLPRWRTPPSRTVRGPGSRSPTRIRTAWPGPAAGPAAARDPLASPAGRGRRNCPHATLTAGLDAERR